MVDWSPAFVWKKFTFNASLLLSIEHKKLCLLAEFFMIHTKYLIYSSLFSGGGSKSRLTLDIPMIDVKES